MAIQTIFGKVQITKSYRKCNGKRIYRLRMETVNGPYLVSAYKWADVQQIVDSWTVDDLWASGD